METVNIASGEWGAVETTAGGVTVICDCGAAAARGLSPIREITKEEAVLLRKHVDAAGKKAAHHTLITLWEYEENH